MEGVRPRCSGAAASQSPGPCSGGWQLRAGLEGHVQGGCAAALGRLKVQQGAPQLALPACAVACSAPGIGSRGCRVMLVRFSHLAMES